MITFNTPSYVRLSLPRLLESCDKDVRVWLWHNGTDEETLEAAQEFAQDDRVHRFHHSRENVRLTPPTNWLWSESDANYVAKVDDDCLLPVNWIGELRRAHEPNEQFGAIAASLLRPEDIREDLLMKKLEEHQGGVRIIRNHWVQGSGYLMKRSMIERRGLLQEGESWTNYCLGLALDGAVNGFLYPLLFEDHMDDPRSEHTLIRTDEDLARRMPLSITRSRVRSVDDWGRQLRRSALEVQRAPTDLAEWRGWRLRLKNARRKLHARRRA